MTQLETVKGPVDAAALGQVLMHERVFVLSAEIMQNYPEDWGEEEGRVKVAVNRQARAHGPGP
jgi:phosphotriesterase-related protein